MNWKYGKKLTGESLLELIEKQYSILFPEQYKKIVVENNKAVPQKENILINGVDRVCERLVSVSKDDNFNISKTITNYEEYIDIAFAKDAFGNSFVFRFNRIDDAKIYFIDHETEKEEYVADSFDEFLEMLM